MLTRRKEQKYLVMSIKISNFASDFSRNKRVRGRAVVARRAHNPEVVGSNPAPATKMKRRKQDSAVLLLFCRCINIYVL